MRKATFKKIAHNDPYEGVKTTDMNNQLRFLAYKATLLLVAYHESKT